MTRVPPIGMLRFYLALCLGLSLCRFVSCDAGVEFASSLSLSRALHASTGSAVPIGIHLAAGSLTLTSQSDQHTQHKQMHTQQNTNAEHTYEEAGISVGGSVDSGVFFSSDFFHSAAQSHHHQPTLATHTFTSNAGIKLSAFDGSTHTAQTLSLHLPSRATWHAMRAAFAAATAAASTHSDSDSPHTANLDLDLDSPMHPLHTHPDLHYQWLVHLKSATQAEIDDVNQRIAPYQLKHFMQKNTFLVSLPYLTALKLTESDSSLSASSVVGPVRFICMYHPSMKVQSGLSSLLADRWSQKVAARTQQKRHRTTDATEEDESPFTQRHTGRTIAHELRITLTYPTLSADAPHRAAFPLNRTDRILTAAFSRHHSAAWNSAASFLDSMSRGSSLKSVPTISTLDFHPINDHQVLVRIPGGIKIEQAGFIQTFIDQLAHHHAVQFIESHSVHHTWNKHARYVVQSDLETSDLCTDTPGNSNLIGMIDSHQTYAETPNSITTQFEAPFYSLLNLHGQDQLLTIGDTGVDYDSCFFYDAKHPNLVLNPSSLQPHRKIAAYMTSPLTDSPTSPRAGPGDDEGHGSHTAGSLAGSIEANSFPVGVTLTEDIVQALANYSGISSQSRLIIFDFQNPSDRSLYVPNDVYHDYLEVSNSFGSRISSNSWGDDSGRYDTYARDVDSFLYDHPDYLMVMAAGNLGSKGLHTIATPAVAKNILTVGSSMNGVCSFFDQGQAAGIDILDPAELRGSFSVTPASFGIPYHESTPHKGVSACYASPPKACTTLANANECAGKVVFVERGDCNFAFKAHMIELAGGIMMAYLHNDPTPNFIIDGQGSYTITIPVITIAQSLGDRLRPILTSSPGSFRLSSPTYFASSDQSEHALSDFSGKGPTLDGRIKPDIIAPGELIESVKSDANLQTFQCHLAQGAIGSDGKHTFEKAENIAAMQGTSMACPIAAGTASIVRQYFTMANYVHPPTGIATALIPSSALIKAILISGTSPVGGTTPVPSTTTQRVDVEPPPSYHQGFGRVELSESLAYHIPATMVGPNGETVPLTSTGRDETSKFKLFVNDNVRIETSQVHRYCFRISNASVPLKATLVWTDPPPAITASILLINNLDLIVVGYNVINNEGHKVYIGNERLHSSTPYQLQFDVNNNVEKCVVEAPVEGAIYTVMVRGTHVPVSGPRDTDRGQAYAIVVNGDFVVESECPSAMICPNDCSGPLHGECQVTQPPVDPNAILTPPQQGTCKCKPNWAGADCSIAQMPMVVDPTTGASTMTNIKIAPDQWSYLSYTVRPGDLTVEYTVTSTAGDPDFYWVTPSQSAGPLNYPTLDFSRFSNLLCDSCGYNVHTQLISAGDLYAPDDAERKGGANIVLGIFGYCCDQATVDVAIRVTR